MGNKPYIQLVFDICWISSVSVLIILPFIFPRLITGTLIFSVFTLIGIGMVFSNKLRKTTIVGKMLYWVAINVFKPRSKYNHLIWGTFIFCIAILSIIVEIKTDQRDIEFFSQIQRSYEFWLGILAVLIFNLIVGVYTAKKHKKVTNG